MDKEFMLGFCGTIIIFILITLPPIFTNDINLLILINVWISFLIVMLITIFYNYSSKKEKEYKDYYNEFNYPVKSSRKEVCEQQSKSPTIVDDANKYAGMDNKKFSTKEDARKLVAKLNNNALETIKNSGYIFSRKVNDK